MIDLPPRLRATVAVQRTLASNLLSRPLLCSLIGAGLAAPRGGRRLDPQAAALLTVNNLDPASDMTQYTPAEARLRMAASIRVVEAPRPSGVVTEDHHAARPGGLIPLRLYTPEGAVAPSPAVVYFHGGGWVVGSVETHDTLCRRLAVTARCRVVSVDYRLAPEHRFPAAVDDVVTAFRWVAQHAGDLGIDVARIAVAGDSAGGNLAAVVARKTRGDARRPALQALIYPGLDGTRSSPSHAEMRAGYFLDERMITWFLDHYLGGADVRHPDFSVLLAEDRGDLPPALIYTAGFDPLRDEGRLYAERLREAGVDARHWEFPSLIHGFAQMSGVIDAARRATGEIMADIGRALRQ